MKPSYLLFLFLLLATSGGMRLPKEHRFSWKACKHASQGILSELWQLHVEKPLEIKANIQFPQPIDCGDNCDPDSLEQNNTHCLEKIYRGLNHYHNLLIWISYSNMPLQNAIKAALDDCHLLKDGGNSESPVSPKDIPAWQKGPLQNYTLWRLQSFAVMMARVISHCASLPENVMNQF